MLEPTSSLDATAPARFDSRVESLRTTAKWLVTISASVGAVLATGLPLTGLGQLPFSSWRLYAAVLAAITALIAVGYMVKISSTLLTQEWLTLAELAEQITGVSFDGEVVAPQRHSKVIVKRLSAFGHELYEHVAESPAQLLKLLQDANRSIHRAAASGDETALAGAVERSRELRRVAHDVAQVANYYLALQLFQSMRPRLALAAAAVVASVLVYAYASNPPQQAGPMEVKIVTQMPAHPRPIQSVSG
jgi:hypothetical protein